MKFRVDAPLIRRRFIAAIGVAWAAAGLAQDPPAWTRPIAPFHIAGPIWYVGTEGLAAYAIRTRDGTILLDATMAENVPAILRNLAAIGVTPADVKLILVSHAHFDHAGGDAAMKRATGAKLVAGVRDMEALRTGHPAGENLSGAVDFSPVGADRGVHDGDVVTLGGASLVARATPGHTPGCTTWTMRVTDRGRALNVVFPCSVSVAGNRLIGNRAYPGIVADYRRSFRRLAAMRADVVLPGHPELADVMGRARKQKLIDPALLGRIVAKAQADFERELAKQAAR